MRFKLLKEGDESSRTAMESVYQPLYDFVSVDVGGQLAVFFTQPVGADQGMGIRKSLADTNMYFASRLPQYCEFSINGLGVMVPREVEAAEVSLVIGAKTYLTLPLELCYVRFPGSRGYVIDLPLLLNSEVNFMVRVRTTKPLTERARVGAVLSGTFDRPIQ